MGPLRKIAFVLSLLVVGSLIWLMGRTSAPSPASSPAPKVPAVSSPALNTIKPATKAEAEMFQQFRPASLEETLAVRGIKDLWGDPATHYVYVASAHEITLVKSAIPFLLIMPDGHRWIAGPQGNVTFLRVPSASVYDIEHYGVLYADPLCALQQLNVLKGDCTNPQVKHAGDWSEMMTHLRRPTLAELKSFLAPEYHASADVHDYFIATSDLRLAPEYRFYDTKGAVIGILVPPGVKVLGGQLGYMDIMTGPDRPALDTICFMYGSSDLQVGPRTFVSQEEIKRVEQGCAR